MPTRKDPTRTTSLQRRFMGDIRKRFRAFKKALFDLVVTQDAFGLEDSAGPFSFNVEKEAFRFQTNPQKIESFRKWFQSQVERDILTVDIKGNPWTAKYADSAYRRGTLTAFIDARGAAAQEQSDFFEGTKEEFLRAAFSQPERVSKIQLLATRSFSELQGLTDDAKKLLNRELANGIANGLGPRAIAKAMAARIDNLTRTRALLIAQTEIIRAHAEGQLDSFEDLGVEEVGVMAEWSTAGDDRVCPLCAPLDGTILTVKEARGLIPRHPRCRCAWIPSIEAEKKNRRKKAAKAFQESIQAERPKASQSVADRKTAWAGKSLRPARVKVSTDPGVIDATQKHKAAMAEQQRLLREHQQSKSKGGVAERAAKEALDKAAEANRDAFKAVQKAKRDAKKRAKGLGGIAPKAKPVKKRPFRPKATFTRPTPEPELEPKPKVKKKPKKKAAKKTKKPKVGVWEDATTIEEAEKRLKSLMGVEKISVDKGVPGSASLDMLNAIGKEHAGIAKRFPKFGDGGVDELRIVRHLTFQGKRTNGAGMFDPLTKEMQIQYVSGRSVVGNQPILGGMTVGQGKNFNSSIPDVFRHELGHGTHFDQAWDKKRRRGWRKIYRENNDEIFNISKYASSTEEEAFAESFSVYTNPKRNKKKHKLPKAIESFFQELLGG